ncbi:hypothetical protein TNCV_3253521 [Trichonephila clavipes]|nr:hypothetical protein TNCV_3253521 [Trichonephila clavipes]
MYRTLSLPLISILCERLWQEKITLTVYPGGFGDTEHRIGLGTVHLRGTKHLKRCGKHGFVMEIPTREVSLEVARWSGLVKQKVNSGRSSFYVPFSITSNPNAVS